MMFDFALWIGPVLVVDAVVAYLVISDEVRKVRAKKAKKRVG